MFGAFWQTHTSCVDYCEFSSLASASAATAGINKADWWHSNMVKGSIVYWFKSRFLHITFLFFAVFFRIDFASLLIYLYSAVDGALCSYSNRLSLSVSWGDIIEQTTAAAASTEIRWATEEGKKWMRAFDRYVSFAVAAAMWKWNRNWLYRILFGGSSATDGICSAERWEKKKWPYKKWWEWEWERVVLYSRRKSNKFYQIKKNSSFPSQNGWHIYRTASANKRPK